MKAPIHHVTAISGSARRNRAFYTGLLGQRMVKSTVNYDDPSTRHLYYADTPGTPGTVLTFFPWEGATPGTPGSGEVALTIYRAPVGSLPFWKERLEAHGLTVVEETAFNAPRLTFTDPDGLRLALAETTAQGPDAPWQTEGIPAGKAIRGFHGVRLRVPDAAPTAAVLTQAFGYVKNAEEGGVVRYTVGGPEGAGPGMGGVVELESAAVPRARLGRGSVHHVAFRATDDAAQQAMVKTLVNLGLHVTEQTDRTYFRSVYFREPGGVIFEIATDGPGFAVDEASQSLGTTLVLPPHLEAARVRIEAALPPLE